MEVARVNRLRFMCTKMGNFFLAIRGCVSPKLLTYLPDFDLALPPPLSLSACVHCCVLPKLLDNCQHAFSLARLREIVADKAAAEGEETERSHCSTYLN